MRRDRLARQAQRPQRTPAGRPLDTQEGEQARAPHALVGGLGQQVAPGRLRKLVKCRAQRAQRTVAGRQLGVQEGQQARAPQALVGGLAQQARHQAQPSLRLLHVHHHALQPGGSLSVHAGVCWGVRCKIRCQEPA